MKVYLAGPMTGYPSFNIPAFDDAAAYLRTMGSLVVVSPAELDDPAIRAISMASPDGAIATLETHGATWGDFLARDVKLLADDGIKAVIVLPGWESSRGARLETYVAHLAGIPVYSYPTLETVPPLELYRAWTGDAGVHLHRNAFDHPVSGTYVPRDGMRMNAR